MNESNKLCLVEWFNEWINEYMNTSINQSKKQCDYE